MNCVQILKSVLDECYTQITGTIEEKNNSIRDALAELRVGYSRLESSGCFDYSNPAKRFAYLYCYTTTHANIVADVCNWSPDILSLFENTKALISCIGGGPGSDFLGVLKCCAHRRLAPQLVAFITDRESSWGESWCDVDSKTPSDIQTSTSTLCIDVRHPEQYQVFKKLLQADLFTMVYFVSEVYADRDKTESFFDYLFSNMKSGAIVLFIDNNSLVFYRWFDAMAERHGMSFLNSTTYDYTLPFDEEKSDFGEYYGLFGSPKLKANIAVRILRKP